MGRVGGRRLIAACAGMWQSLTMDKKKVLEILRAHESELRAAGILHLRLFGSVARGEVHPGSDVDLMADFDRSRTYSILNYVHLENQLADLLAAKVDLSAADNLKQSIREDALQDAILAF